MTNISLIKIKRTDSRILENMANHYSQPKGFVGRNICYAVIHNWKYYGAIVGGSTPAHLPGRENFFAKYNISPCLENIVNNLFFHVEGPYPVRNFVPKVIEQFRWRIEEDWQARYFDPVICFESLVELPRTGDCYKRDKWEEVGLTKGFTCKRIAGYGTDNWSGKRVWNTNPNELRPKRVFMRMCD